MKLFKRTRRNHEGADAREQAEANLAKTKAQTAAYAELAQSLREIRKRNHFADGIVATFRGDRK